MAKGIYREGDNAVLDHPRDAIITDYFLHRDVYTTNGYEPPFDQLPTKNEWERTRPEALK